MSAGLRMPLSEARVLADELVGLLADACRRLEVAGSVRRGKPDVGDIELLAIPRLDGQMQKDLFGAPVAAPMSLLDLRVDSLLQAGVLAPRLNVNGQQSIGPKNKFLLYQDFAVDLFITTLEGWAVSLVIRTGPADFNKAIVTRRSQYGLCPDHLQVHVGPGQIVHRRDQEVVPTATEAEVFEVLGIPWLEPSDRESFETGRRTWR